jgi:hypothetical protein
MRLCFLICFLTGITLNAQNKLLLSSDSVYWFGMDFSKAKFMGDFVLEQEMDPKTAGSDLVNNEIHRWNDLFFKEQLNYNLKGALKKNYLFADVSHVTKLNRAINPDSVFSESKSLYKWENPDKIIESMVSQYTSTEFTKGLGLCFIVEYFNKKAEEASIYTVFFDIENKKVIGYKRLKGVAKGIGIRNHWGGAIKSIINQLGSSAYPSLVWQLKKK